MPTRRSPDDLDFAAVFAALPGATAVFAADPPHFAVLAVSDAWLERAKRPRDSVVGRPLSDAFPDAGLQHPLASELSELRASLAAAVQTGAPQRMDRQPHDLQRPAGALEARYWDSVNIPVRGPDGAVRYVLHQSTEVTAQVYRQAAAAQRRAERIIEYTGDAHCVLDREFRIVSVNAAAERVLGVTRASLVGRSHWEAFPASVDAPVGRALRRVVAEGIEQHLTHHYTGEGYDLHLELDAYPTDEGGVAMFWRDVSERVRAQAALRASEEKYRALFNEMDEAYAVVEVLADAAGCWTDFRFLEVNPVFMRHTGMPYPVGRTATELLGAPNPRWAELYGRAAETGESIRVEESELALGRIVDLNIFRLGGPGSRKVAVLFADITERERAEAVLQESESRQAFLLSLSDAVRRLSDPLAIMAMTSEKVGRRFEVGRCGYAEVPPPYDHLVVARDWTNGRMPSLQGAWPLASFGEKVIAEYRTKRTVVFEDGVEDDRVRGGEPFALAAGGVRASISVQLMKGGEWVASFYVQDTSARRWTPGEIALMEDLAERTWAAVERARAEKELRESELRYRTLFDSIDDGFCVIEVLFDDAGRSLDYRFLETNPAFVRQTGLADAVGRSMRELVPEHEAHWFEAFGRVALTGEPIRFEAPAAALGRWYDVYALRIGDPAAHRVAILFSDIGERKRVEAVLRASEARQAYLLKLSDALRPLSDALEIRRTAMRVLGEHLQVDRVLYSEVDDRAGTHVIADNYVRGARPKLTGRFLTSAFGAATDRLRAGETFAMDDIASDERLSAATREAFLRLDVRASIGVPLVKNGRWVANFDVHDGQARTWTAADIALVEETAERAWGAVERGRVEAALRESEARLQLALDAAQMGTFVSYPEEDRSEMDARALALYGLEPGDPLSHARALGEVVIPADRAAHAANLARALDPAGEGALRSEYRIRRPRDGAERWIAALGQTQFAGEPRVAVSITGICADIRRCARPWPSARRC